MVTPPAAEASPGEGLIPVSGIPAFLPLLGLSAMWAIAQTRSADDSLPYAVAVLWGPLFGVCSHVFWRKTPRLALLAQERVLVLGEERIPLGALVCVAPYGSKKNGPGVLVVWWRDERGLPRTGSAGFFGAPKLRVFAQRVCDASAIGRRASPPGAPFAARDIGGAFVGVAVVAQAATTAMSGGTVWALGPTLCLATVASITCLLVRSMWRVDLT
jgi:hypothetical protein